MLLLKLLGSYSKSTLFDLYGFVILFVSERSWTQFSLFFCAINFERWHHEIKIISNFFPRIFLIKFALDADNFQQKLLLRLFQMSELLKGPFNKNSFKVQNLLKLMCNKFLNSLEIDLQSKEKLSLGDHSSDRNIFFFK